MINVHFCGANLINETTATVTMHLRLKVMYQETHARQLI